MIRLELCLLRCLGWPCDAYKHTLLPTDIQYERRFFIVILLYLCLTSYFMSEAIKDKVI
jgi:hypothetical protein